MSEGDGMSLKSIDLQLVLSRTNNTSTLQNQLLHKPADDQFTLAGDAQKTADEVRQKSNKVDESLELHVREDQTDSGRQSGKQQDHQKHKDKEAATRIEHPYKGHHIDLSL